MAVNAVETTAFRDVYTLAFVVSPIFFVGGIASTIPGGILPFVALVGSAAGLLQGALSSGSLKISDFPAQFRPLPGTTLIRQTVGQYPFANQQVAANAVIDQPKTVSLRMIAPVNTTGGYITKLPFFLSIQKSFSTHNASGGTYTILTPAGIFANCVMLGMTDITAGETKQDQIEWQLDFEKPLISLSAAKAAMNGMMNKLSSMSPLSTSSPTGALANVGNPAGGSLLSGLEGIIGSAAQQFPTSVSAL